LHNAFVDMTPLRNIQRWCAWAALVGGVVAADNDDAEFAFNVFSDIAP
jgi:hypothetical protein